MADNVIRKDVVQVSFEVDNGGLTQANKQINDFKKSFTGGLDSSVNKFKQDIGGINKAVNELGKSKGIDKLKNDIETANAALGVAKDKFSAFGKAIKGITTHPIKTLDKTVLGLQMSAGRARLEFKNLAKTKVDNLKSKISDVKNVLTEGKTGAKGFGNALKNIGKVGLGKTLNGFYNLKNNIKQSTPSAEQLKNKLKGVSDKLTDIGKKAAGAAFSGLKKLAGISFKALSVGIGAAATAIGGLVYKSVQAYGNYEQLVGGVETLLGAKGAKTVEEYAKSVGKSVKQVQGEFNNLKTSEKMVLENANNAYKSAGLSANDYMETVTGFSASLLQSVGGDTKKAAEYADMAVKDMADNANKMGTDMGSIQWAYQGFAKQNYTMLDNLKLGYGGTKSEMQRLVKDAAKLDKSINANSLSYGNIVKAIHAVQVKMDIYGTTQKEAEHTITGSLSAMQSAWGNLLTAMASGENLDQCINNMVDAVEIFGNNVMPVAEKALGGIGTLIERLTPVFEKEFPKLAQKMLPPLIKAAVSLTKGLIKALPNLIKTVATTIVDIFGQQFPIIGKIGKLFENNAGKIANATTKVIIPAVIALIAAFKGFKALSFIKSIFGKSAGGGGGFFSNITSMFKGLAQTNTKTVLKGMLNLTIILGGLGALVWTATKVFKDGIDMIQMLKVVALIGVFGIVGGALGKFAGMVGNIPVTTVLKGFANMAIMLVGIGAVVWAATKVFKNGVNFAQMLKTVALIGVFGLVGTALSALAGIIGLIPIMLVIKGLANMGIVLVGMGALLWTATKVFKDGINFTQIYKVISLIGILGTVGSVLSVFAGIVGLIPIPIVLSGLANIALVLGGMTVLIEAFGALSQIPGFTYFLEKGGEVLTKICNIIGDMVGSFVGGLAEGITNSLPKIGKSISDFAVALEPMFKVFNGVDMGGIGQFFGALGGFLLQMAGNNILSFFTGGNDLGNVGTQLDNFAHSAQSAFNCFAEYPQRGIENAPKILNAIKGIGSYDFKSGGLAQLFTGEVGLAAIGTQLDSFAHSAQSAFNCFAEFPDRGIENAPKILDAIKNIGSYDFKSGGLAQLFTGEVGLAAIGTQLDSFAHSAQSAFNCFAEYPQQGIKNAPKILKAINGIGSYDFKTGGLAQLGTGEIGLDKIGTQLDSFAHSAQSAFNCFAEFPQRGIENAPRILSAIKNIGGYDYKSGGLAQLFTGETDLSKLGKQLDGFAHSAQSAFNCFAEFPDRGIGNANRVIGTIRQVGNLTSINGDIEAFGRKFDSFAHSAQSAFNCFAEFNDDVHDKINKIAESIKKLGEASNVKIDTTSLDSFANSLKAIDKLLDDFVAKVSKLPEQMGDGIKNAGTSLSSAIADIWTQAVKASVAPVNKLLDAANWILKEFGSDKKVISWKPYANGTDGHKGGNAVVNDGRGAELVQMPNGNTFIPQGKNVFIPNAPKGMKVLSAEQTATLMGRKSPTFNYADGTGNIDIWEYYDNAKGLVDKKTENIKYDGLSGFRLNLSQSMVSTFSEKMTSWVKKLFDEEGGKSLASYVASKGVEQWRSTVIRALKMEGQYSEANVKRTLFQMQTESGGNPRAINLWDSNARKGIPSKGLMQCIDPTFKAYARKGFDKNIYDPLSNILASIRYAVARYGSLANAYKGHGYANGGFANKPSIFGEDGAEVAIPLTKDKRKRALGLWQQTGNLLGITARTPENSVSTVSQTNKVENNNYSPVFNLTINGDSNDRTTERKVKRWISEAMDEVFSSMERKHPRLQEV